MRLNVGCGSQIVDGWVNVDREPLVPFSQVTWSSRNSPVHGDRVTPKPGDVFRCDVLDGLPFDDDTFVGAVAHHVLQMVDRTGLEWWLREVRRVLKPGAWLRVTVPDLLGAVAARDDYRPEWFPIDDSLEASIDGKLCVYLSQCGSTRSVFTLAWLNELCDRAGFGTVHGSTSYAIERQQTTLGLDWLTDLDSRLPESIVVEARA